MGLLDRLRRFHESTPGPKPYPYVYVNADGTAQELHPDERAYLDTEFDGADGARPYIKWRYASRDGRGELSGYLERSKLPRDMVVLPAPAENPNVGEAVEDEIADLQERGWELTTEPDGTRVLHNPKSSSTDE